VHKKEVGADDAFPKSGYPDMGNGRFAATLSYADWYLFNNAQRAHYNLVENFAPALSLHILSGLFFPRVTAASGALWILCRHVWASNYVSKGPNGRYGGIAGLHILCLLGWFGASVYGGLATTKLIKGF
jgi:glutathione S-transferase